MRGIIDIHNQGGVVALYISSNRQAQQTHAELKLKWRAVVDYFLFNGKIDDDRVLEFMEYVDTHSDEKSDSVTFFLCTYGGDANAAFKMGQYIQSRYKRITCVIPGKCKSAGALLAIAASELKFMPYGELGPLDVQLAMSDEVIFRMQSGLNLNAAFSALENHTSSEFHKLMEQIIAKSRGAISFGLASQISREMVASKFSHVYARIDSRGGWPQSPIHENWLGLRRIA